MTKLSRIALAHLGAAMLVLTPAAHAQTACGTTAHLLSNLINGCTIGDKLFANFTATVGGTSVAGNLTLTGAPFVDALHEGFFLGLPGTLPFTVSAGAPLLIAYSVSVFDPTLFLITDIHLGLTGSASALGLVTETVTGINVNQTLFADLDPLTLTIGNTADAIFSGVGTLAVIKTITDIALFGSGGIEQTVSQTAVGHAVPEPASLALLGLGLTGLAVARRRKQN